MVCLRVCVCECMCVRVHTIKHGNLLSKQALHSNYSTFIHKGVNINNPQIRSYTRLTFLVLYKVINYWAIFRTDEKAGL